MTSLTGLAKMYTDNRAVSLWCGVQLSQTRSVLQIWHLVPQLIRVAAMYFVVCCVACTVVLLLPMTLPYDLAFCSCHIIELQFEYTKNSTARHCAATLVGWCKSWSANLYHQQTALKTYAMCQHARQCMLHRFLRAN